MSAIQFVVSARSIARACVFAVMGLGMSPSFAHHTPEHSAAIGSAPSDTVPLDALSVTSCWIRSLPAQIPSAAYFTLANASGTPATLTGVNSDAYASVMMHASSKHGGMASMSMAHDVRVAPRSRVVFAPGGLHVMLEKPIRPLVVGETLTFTFTFAGEATLDAPCEVRPASTLAP